MKYLTTELISELDAIVKEQLTYLHERIIPLEEEDLTWRPGKFRWNIYEVVEHLNRFGDFYMPKFTTAIEYSNTPKKSDYFKSGFIGEFSSKRIRPVNGVIPFKAKSPSKTNPFLRILDRSVFEDHEQQQKKLGRLLIESEEVNWNRNRMPTIVSSWLKLNLGDSLRIYIYHAERHYVQIDNLVNKRTE